MKRKFLASLLALSMLLGLLPASALAVEGEGGDGPSVKAETLFPTAEEENEITITGGSGRQTVRISGYRAPWYVTDGLVLHYDGIYNQGVGKEYDSNADTWEDLAGSFNLTMPSFASGEGWKGNGLYLKDTSAFSQSFSESKTMTNGFTLDYSFALDSEYTKWNAAAQYLCPIKVETASNYHLGSIGSCGGSQTGKTWVLFYGGGRSSIFATPAFDTDFAQVTLTTGGIGTVRAAYRDGTPMSTYNNVTPQADTENFTLNKVILPAMNITLAMQGNSGEAFNLGRTVYGLRLYDRELTADEVAQNAEADRLRYEDDSWNNNLGTFNEEVLIEQFDGDDAYIDVEVTFDENGTATIPLVLNNAGAEELTFSIVESGSVTETIGTLSMTVLTEAESQQVETAQTAINALPDAEDITEDNFNEHLEKVAAAQAALANLDEALQAAISDEDKENLAACIEAINTSASGNLTVTVTYDAGEGTITTESATITYGETYTLDIPTRANYTFTGWYADKALRTKLTDAYGKSLGVWNSLSDATVYAGWKHNTEVTGAALEIDEAEDIYALARILGKSGTNEDYARFGMTQSTTNQDALRKASYVLTSNISLTNYTEDSSNGFYGIPDFQGTFDGQGNTITLDIDFGKYMQDSTNKHIGGVFQTISNATVQNVKLDGTATGTLTLNVNTTGIGLLIGQMAAGTCRVENVSSAVAVNMTLDSNEDKCCYFAPVVGYLVPANAEVVLENCENTGSITVKAENSAANASRVGGLVGHSSAGTTLESCTNAGSITVTGDKLNVGDLQGSSNGTTYRSCVSAGSVTVETGSPTIFAGMKPECAQDDGNVIRISVTGKAGETITAQGGVSVTLASDGATTIDLPVFRAGRDTQLYSKYVVDEDIKVDGQRSLYLFDLFSREFITSLNTANAAAEALPFSSWATAIPISTQADFLNMCKAFDDKDEDAIKALYQLGRRNLGSTDLDTAQMLLRSAYYVLKNNVTIDDANFAGIGRVNSFGGHFDGGGHTVTYTINDTFDSASSDVYYGLFGGLSPLTDGVVEVKNLNVAATLDITAGNTGSYTTYVGGLAGNASSLTTENVHVTVNSLKATKTEDAPGSCEVGGVFGAESGILLGEAPTVTIAGPFTVAWKTSNCNVGGFAGRSVAGGNVEFAAGSSGIQATSTGNGTPRVGGITGYSWSPNDFTGLSVKNSSGTEVTLSGGTTGCVGLLLGYHQTTSAAPGSVGLKVEDVEIDGAFTISGRYIGGLFGYVSTTGHIIIQDTAVGEDVTLAFAESASGPVAGGLIGYNLTAGAALEIRNSASGAVLPTGSGTIGGLIGYNASTTVTCESSAYVNNTGSRNAVGSGNDLSAAVAIDVTKLTSGTFGTAIEALSATAPASLTITGDVELDGKNVTFTKAGEATVMFKWGDVELCTVKAAVSPLDVSATAEIADVMSEYLYTGSAITPEIQVVNNGVLLEKDTDYTVTYSDNTSVGTATITVTFTGNYTGTKTATFEIKNEILDVTAEDYTAVYDGNAHSIKVNVPDGATITYGTSEDSCNNTDPITQTDADTLVVYWAVVQDSKSVTGSSVLSITPRPLTIKADNQTVQVNGTPVFSYTQTGSLVGTDAIQVTYTWKGSTDEAGTSSIVPSVEFTSGKASNYEVTCLNGTLTVTSATTPVTPSNPGSSSSSSSGYAVTVDSGKNGTVSVSPKSASKGTTVTITVKPNSGYELDSLTVTDKNGKAVKVTEGKNGKYTFTMPASKVTVEATFAKIEEHRFVDVPDGYWAEDEITWAYENGYMNGNTATTFNPNGTVTRQQLWMILARLSGYQPADFAEAKAWAVDNGISDGTVPGNAVSRQQLVTILYRYAARMGYKTTGAADLTAFPDHASVAAYATDAMTWSVANNIVGGTTQGTLNPTGTATRAQFAVILYRFCENIVK